MVGAGARLAQIELTFYRVVRPRLEIEAPRTLHAAFDPVSHRQMLLTDDVAVTRGATFGSALDRTLTREQAEQLVRTLAGVHARFWGEPLERMFGDWLRGVEQYLAMLDGALNARARILSGFDRARDVIAPELYARRHEAYDALRRSQHLSATTEPATFLHGDVHPGNWYLTAEGILGLYDWQMCVIGGPGRDLAYALTTHLPTEDRRAWERDLLGSYLEELGARGVKDRPAPDQLFVAYRRQAVYGLWAWLATIGRSPLQPRYQPDGISRANLARISRACVDLETFDTIAAP
jgi:thiamine kinase-like enzyme